MLKKGTIGGIQPIIEMRALIFTLCERVIFTASKSDEKEFVNLAERALKWADTTWKSLTGGFPEIDAGRLRELEVSHAEKIIQLAGSLELLAGKIGNGDLIVRYYYASQLAKILHNYMSDNSRRQSMSTLKSIYFLINLIFDFIPDNVLKEEN